MNLTSIQCADEMAMALCDALGVPTRNIKKVVITFDAGRLPEVHAEYVVAAIKDGRQTMETVARRFECRIQERTT